MTSRLIVNSIRHTGASADAITLDNSGNATFPANVTCSGTATGFGGRIQDNLIVNGAMNVAQRALSATGSGANGYSTVDRFALDQHGTDAYPSMAQADVASGTTPYTLGFRKSLKITNGNQSSGAGSSDRLAFEYKIEAQDMATSGWNYLSSSSYVTFTYWVKSSVAQNFYNTFTTDDGTSQRYVTETGSLSADTWTKITKTIPGNSNLTFNNDNEEGLGITWELFRGTDQTGTRPLNAWAASANATRTPDQTSTWYTTNSATFEITGVQLEVGSSSSDFQHLSYADDLAKCQRYFYLLADHDGQTHNACFGRGESLNSTSVAIQPYYPVTMRDAPSAVTTATASPSFLAYEFNSYYHVTGNWNIHATSPQTGQVYATTNDMGGNNKPMRVQTDASVAKLGFDAEL